MISQTLRKIILSQFQRGFSLSQVVQTFESQCSKSTIARILRDSRSKKRIRKKRGPRRKIDPNMEKRIIHALTVSKRPATIRSTAKKEKVGATTVQRMLKRKGVRTFKKVKRFLITHQNAARRKICCGRFRKKYGKADLHSMIWVDESYIVVGEYLNSQNERCYGKRFDLIPDSNKIRLVPKSPLTAMVFVAVWPEGRSDLVVLPSGFRITSQTYIESCLEPLVNSLPTALDKKKVIFYQDLAPAHRAKKTQGFLKKNFPCFVPASETPPNSPDLNPLDYCLWSILKERLNKYDLIPNFERLAEILRNEWNSIPQHVIQGSCNSWLTRVRAVERANGFYID